MQKAKLWFVYSLVQPSITSILDDASLEMGKQFKKTCSVTGNPLPSVVWTKDGSYTFPTGYLTDNNNTLIIERVQQEDAGVYNCTASNIVGSTWDSLQLKVLEQKVISTNDGSFSICSNVRLYKVSYQI